MSSTFTSPSKDMRRFASMSSASSSASVGCPIEAEADRAPSAMPPPSAITGAVAAASNASMTSVLPNASGSGSGEAESSSRGSSASKVARRGAVGRCAKAPRARPTMRSMMRRVDGKGLRNHPRCFLPRPRASFRSRNAITPAPAADASGCGLWIALRSLVESCHPPRAHLPVRSNAYCAPAVHQTYSWKAPCMPHEFRAVRRRLCKQSRQGMRHIDRRTPCALFQ